MEARVIDPITAASPSELHRIALRHLRAAERLAGRYGAERDIAAHVSAARVALERALRSEDDTQEIQP